MTRRRVMVAGLAAAVAVGIGIGVGAGLWWRSASQPVERRTMALDGGVTRPASVARPGGAPLDGPPQPRPDTPPDAQPGSRPTPAEVERTRNALLRAQQNAERAAAASLPPRELQARKAAALADFRAAEADLLRQQTLAREARRASDHAAEGASPRVAKATEATKKGPPTASAGGP